MSLDIVDSGSLVVLNALDDSGLIDVESTGGAATLQVDGPVRIDASATIEVSGSAAAATFLGDQIGNAGTMSALDGGTMSFIGATVFNQGEGATITADGSGSVVDLSNTTIHGGTLETSSGGLIQTVSNGTGIDLAGVWTVESETTSGTTVMLDLQDGSGHDVDLTFDEFTGTLNVAADGHGGTLVTDPPAATTGGSPSAAVTIANIGLNFGNDQISLAQDETDTQSVGSRTGSVSVGGPGNDNFVFHPGIGADTIANFNPQADTIQLDNFANVQNVQQLALLITADAHGAAVIDLGHHDSITLPGVTASYLQAHLQSLVHLG